MGRKRKYQVWLPQNWDSGYVVRRKYPRSDTPRVMVYRPDYPKSSNKGYALRAHVVWWLGTGAVPKKGYVIHHLNHNSLDDKIDNLAMWTRKAHSAYHHEKSPPQRLTCPVCSIEFTVQFNIISQHLKEGRKHGQKYCSSKCYNQSQVGQRGFSRRGMTVVKVKRLRRMREAGVKVRELSAEFGISQSAVSAIIHRVNWGDVK